MGVGKHYHLLPEIISLQHVQTPRPALDTDDGYCEDVSLILGRLLDTDSYILGEFVGL